MAICKLLIVFVCVINWAICIENGTLPQQPTLMSRIASWIFPFGGGGDGVETTTDSVPAEGHYNGPHYLPPPSSIKSNRHQHSIDIDCNPCNRVPWIPIVGRSGKNTVINFAPSSHGNLPAGQQYGPPAGPQQPPPLPSTPPNTQYGPPVTNLHYNPPSEPQFNPPPPLPDPAPDPQYNPQYGPPLPHVQNGPVLFRPQPSLHQSEPLLNPPPPPSLTINHRPRPIKNYGVPGMLPPPLHGNRYFSLPTNLPAPQKPLFDSYGAPVTGPNGDFKIRQEFVPPPPPPSPIEPVPLSSDYRPIPLPNLSSRPVLPIHDYKNFHQHLPPPVPPPQHSTVTDIQIVPSVKVGDFLATIEHPINIIQSPLLDVAVRENQHSDIRPGSSTYESSRLSENPIIVDDTHTAASIRNNSYQNADNNQIVEHEEKFTQPPIDNGAWAPAWSGTISTSMVPPPLGPFTWLPTSTTNIPKQVQIIVPYVNRKQVPDISSTLVPPASTRESVWSKFIDHNSAESQRITQTTFTSTTTPVSNIIDILKDSTVYQTNEQLPFDVISLQNHIDNWTQQQYSKRMNYAESTSVSDTITKLVPSKQIPNEYFNTELTTIKVSDYQAAGSDHKDIETNFIFDETTESTTEVPTTKLSPAPFTISSTKEKVYIVTPQSYQNRPTTPKSTIIGWSLPPQISQSTNNRSTSTNVPKFLIRIDPDTNNHHKLLNDSHGPLTVVFSEWPHLINNLQTTTTTEKPPTSRHPLLGLMDIQAYTPPPNSTVQTISGHLKVVTVVTPGANTKVSPTTEKPTNLEIVTPTTNRNRTDVL